jgi:glutamine amidotransferase
MITVIDYGMGNAGSIMNMFLRIDVPAILTRDPLEIAAAKKLVLPGVGAFDKGMQQLRSLDLVNVLGEKVMAGDTPLLGICLGMQLFAESSEEGDLAGLGWIPGRVLKFHFGEDDEQLPIPHMGWNTVAPKIPHPVLSDLDDSSRFYFVHSYHFQCSHAEDALGTTPYGFDFVSAVTRGSVIGVQFHPEKSLRWGMQLFKRFAQL